MTCQNLVSFHSSCHALTKGVIKEDTFHRDAILFVSLYNCICNATCVNLHTDPVHHKDLVHLLKIEGLFKCIEIVKMTLRKFV